MLTIIICLVFIAFSYKFRQTYGNNNAAIVGWSDWLLIYVWMIANVALLVSVLYFVFVHRCFLLRLITSSTINNVKHIQ